MAIKEWAELLNSNELDLYRLVLNTAVSFYFWGLLVEKNLNLDNDTLKWLKIN